MSALITRREQGFPPVNWSQCLVNALACKVGPGTQVTGNATYQELAASCEDKFRVADKPSSEESIPALRVMKRFHASYACQGQILLHEHRRLCAAPGKRLHVTRLTPEFSNASNKA